MSDSPSPAEPNAYLVSEAFDDEDVVVALPADAVLPEKSPYDRDPAPVYLPDLDAHLQAKETLRAAATAFEQAQAVYEQAKQTWKSAVETYQETSGKPLNLMVDEHEQRLEEAYQAEEEIRAAERERTRLAEEQERTATDGPADFVGAPIKETRRGFGRSTGRVTVHVKGCRRMGRPSYLNSNWRPASVVNALQHGGVACRFCKPVDHLIEVFPALAEQAQEALAASLAAARPISAKKVTAALRKPGNVPVHRVDRYAGGGDDGFQAEDQYLNVTGGAVYGVKIVWTPIGQYRSEDFSEREAKKALLALLEKREMHLSLTHNEERRFSSGLRYKNITAWGVPTGDALEGLYATLDADLLVRGLLLGLSTVQMLDFARRGEFTPEAVATLEALNSSPDSLALVAAP